ncbi:MAG TPA: fumarylacetoacetate hydrolase family protein [Candidatus Limnocylindrales bacterium]|nr:fumarylacetoacetate hydrolase family protein [Candidatus Limnocylindrales bacterium]
MSSVADLDAALLGAKAIPQLNLGDVQTAYEVQAELLARRIERGERLAGVKMGLTSKAKMAQVGVDQVIRGWLTDAMRVPDGGSVSLDRFIHPRIEPEVAFLVRDGAIAAVAPALEIIDSRYADFKFTLPDVIADNCSAAAYVIGPWSAMPSNVDNVGVLLEVDGAVVQVGSTAAILGDPRRAFDQGATMVGELMDGWVFLAGAATAAVPLSPGSFVRAVVEGLGSASVRAA